MFVRLLILVAFLAGALWFLRWFRRTPPEQVAKVLRRTLLYGVIGLVAMLAATGRLDPLVAALAAAVPVAMRLVNLLRLLPAIQQILRMLGIPGAAGAANPTAAGHTSAIRTRFLDMTLDHNSGRMEGIVLEGAFQGRRLSDLALGQLLDLLDQCRAADAQSAAVLESYLDRTHGQDWRGYAPGAGTGTDYGVSDAPMTCEEALAILGLKPGADADAIREAHRRLMQKFHPDRGGSDYLAAKINRAKGLLLGD